MLLFITLTLVPGLLGQPRSADYDAYCRDNPKMPTCQYRDLKLTTPAMTQSRPAARMTATPVKIAHPEHLWRFAAPGTMMIAGVRLRAMRESESWRATMDQLRGLLPTGSAGGFFDSLEDIDEVWLSADAGRNAQPVLLMRGRFDGPAWRKQLPAAYRATPSIDTLLMGTATGIAAAKRRIAASTAPAVEIAALAQRMAAAHDLWVVANGQELLAQGLKPAANAPAVLAHLRGMALGITLRDPLIADLRAESDSPEAAAQILEWLRKSTEDNNDLQDAGGKLEIRQEGNSIHLRLEMDAARTRTMIAERTRSKTAPAPRKPGKVVIYGMEGGTREIPYGTPQQ